MTRKVSLYLFIQSVSTYFIPIVGPEGSVVRQSLSSYGHHILVENDVQDTHKNMSRGDGKR